MSWLDTFLDTSIVVEQAGTKFPFRPALNFLGNASVADNSTNNSTDITISGGIPGTRQVIAGSGLTGGGPLTSDVTLALNPVINATSIHVTTSVFADSNVTIGSSLTPVVGSIRGQANFSIWAENAADTQSMQLLALDGADNINIGVPGGPSVIAGMITNITGAGAWALQFAGTEAFNSTAALFTIDTAARIKSSQTDMPATGDLRTSQTSFDWRSGNDNSGNGRSVVILQPADFGFGAGSQPTAQYGSTGRTQAKVTSGGANGCSLVSSSISTTQLSSLRVTPDFFTLSAGQAASGVGQDCSVIGEQGFAGSVGGRVIIRSGDGGTPGTNLPGDIWLDVATPVSNVTSKVYITRNAGTVALLDVWQSASGITTLASGANGTLNVNPVSALTMAPTQAVSGIGVTSYWYGQQSAAGSVGSIVRIGGGQGGTPGTNQAGQIVLDAGQLVSSVSGKVSICSNSNGLPTGTLTSIFDLSQTSSINATMTTPLRMVLNGAAVLSLQVGGVTALDIGGGFTNGVRLTGPQVGHTSGAAATTTDATTPIAVSALDWTPASGFVYGIRYFCVARNSSGNAVRFVVEGAVEGTTPAISGTPVVSTPIGNAALVTVSATLTLTGGKVRINVTGVASTTLTWTVYYELWSS